MPVLEEYPSQTEEVLQQLERKIPCRWNQVKLLVSLCGEKDHLPPPAIFLYGHTGTGKSLVTQSVINQLKAPHVNVHCVECYSQKFLFEHILSSLASGSEVPFPKCDNMNDFIRLFKQITNENGMNKETVYIVLDKAERLRDKEANLLPAFLRLQELTGQNVCVLFLSEIVWEKFRTGTGFCEPYIIHFPDYTKDEVIEIVSLSCPEGYTKDFFMPYVSLVLSIFHLACRDLKEIRHLAVLNFPKYIEPVTNGEATINDTRKLWKSVEPHLKKALQTVYLREVSSSQWERFQQQALEDQQSTHNLQGLSHRSHVELPFYSKYLLIAAYLASYNPAKSDKRFFAKNAGKTSKRSKLIKKHERTTNHLLGPKPFPMDRLLAIFYSIVEERVAPTANIFMQITSLVTLNLMAQIAGDDQIDTPKYKCLVSLDFIKSVARNIGFDIIRYLYDFV